MSKAEMDAALALTDGSQSGTAGAGTGAVATAVGSKEELPQAPAAGTEGLLQAKPKSQPVADRKNATLENLLAPDPEDGPENTLEFLLTKLAEAKAARLFWRADQMNTRTVFFWSNMVVDSYLSTPEDPDSVEDRTMIREKLSSWIGSS